MSASPYTYQRYLLGSLRAELKLDELQALALQPVTKAAYRVSCHYPKLTPPNSVATLLQQVGQSPSLHIVYEGSTSDIQVPIDVDTFQAFSSAMLRVKFDRLDDPPGIPSTGAVLWLVERAAAGFYKAVLLSPTTVQPPHDALVAALEQHIPQAVQPLEVSDDWA